MELWRAATAAALLRAEGENRARVVTDYVQMHDDWMQGVMLWFDDEPRIGYSWFLSRVTAYYGIHPEEWGVLTAERALVPLLADESAGNRESDWSIDYTLRVLDSMKERTLGEIVSALSEHEAYLFWQVALGERPPISKHAMLKAVAHSTQYDIGELQRAVAYTPFLEVVERAFDGTVPSFNPMEPGTPLSPCPRYWQWKSIVLPFPTTYIEVLSNPRSYLHYDGAQARLYTRAGRMVGGWASDHVPAIYEVDTDDDFSRDTIAVRDILWLDGRDVWKENYTERKAMIEHKVRPVTTMAELRKAVRDLGEGEHLRLLDDVPYYDDAFKGGYVMNRHPMRVPLLVTQARKVDEIKVNVRLSALDGFALVQVAEVWCPDDVATVLRTHPKLGPVIGDVWTRMDDVGCIIDVAAYGMQGWIGHYHLQNPEILGIDSRLGYSDTVQLSDLLMMMGGDLDG